MKFLRPTVSSVRPFVAVLAMSSLALAACGGSDSDDPESTSNADTVAPTTVEATAVPTTEPAIVTDPVEETVVETTPATTPDTASDTVAGTDPAGELASGAVAAELSEWSIEAPTEYAAGEVVFTATNGGSFPHELVVIQGEGYESLPRTEAGAIIEEELPTGALLGRTARIAGGASEDLTVTLAPGNYVLLCNLGGGDNSHAGQGQRLDITVS
jgi:hypothetical protein